MSDTLTALYWRFRGWLAEPCQSCGRPTGLLHVCIKISAKPRL